MVKISAFIAQEHISSYSILSTHIILHVGHLLLVSQGSTGCTFTPASAALYSIYPRNSANAHLLMRSRCFFLNRVRFRMPSRSSMATHQPVSVAFQSDLLCNRMVGIRFKSSLSPGYRFQFTFGVQWPFAAAFLFCRFSLKRSFHFFIMLSCSFNIIAHHASRGHYQQRDLRRRNQLR